jgi:hypothetical protein
MCEGLVPLSWFALWIYRAASSSRPPVPIPRPTSHENPARIQMTEKSDEAALLHKLSPNPDFMNLHEIVHKARQNLN